jgi:hypothetical protein
VAFEREEFLALMPETVSVAAVTATDGYGKRTYGTATSYRARVRHKTQRIFSVNNVEEWAKHKVWIAPNADGTIPTLDARSLVTLPDGSQPPVLAVDHVTDEDGVHHVLVWFGDTARVQ